MDKLESRLDDFESELDSRLANIDKALETLSKRQEETVGALEERIKKNSELVTGNSKLVLSNAKQIQRLIRLTQLDPDARVKKGASEDHRRTYLAASDIGKTDDEFAPLEPLQLVRTTGTTKKVGDVTYVKVKYVNRVQGEVSQDHYIRQDVLESLH